MFDLLFFLFDFDASGRVSVVEAGFILFFSGVGMSSKNGT